MPESYRVAPIFVIRLAGVPFDTLGEIATPESSSLGRQLIEKQHELATARESLERFVGSRQTGLSADDSRAIRALLKNPAQSGAPRLAHEPVSIFVEAAANVARAEAALHEHLDAEVVAARTALLKASRDVLPRYLVFGAGAFGERVDEIVTAGNGPAPQPGARNAKMRERERHLLLYLQRVAAKNDTFSEFGPSAWSTIRQSTQLELNCEPKVAKREAFFERWVAHAIAAALNADPEVHALLERHQLPAVQVPALEPYAFDVLMNDVRKWPECTARARWLEFLEPLAQLPGQFVAAESVPERAHMMDAARERLRQLGAARTTTQRFLYAATNPIAEECARNCQFVLPQRMADELVRDAEPWIDLWRDSYAFVASRVSAALRGLLAGVADSRNVAPLPEFLRHCEANKMPLTSAGMVAPAVMAFVELKAAFRALIGERACAAEIQLTQEDCHFVRRNFEYPHFDEFTFPSADLQISAQSVAAADRGEYDWIISEFHPPIALLHHAFFWSCSDPLELARHIASTTLGQPAFHYGFFAADFTAHTVVHQMDVLPNTAFVTPQRGHPNWRSVRPADAEVFVDEPTGDVRVRQRESGELLGSFARSWIIPLGFHPFHFGRAPHMPRLRCGKVIVQRRSWTVTQSELGELTFSGISSELVLAVERLRARRDLPRYVYIRPTEQALRRSGAEGRDKDTKPVFIDLESYLFLEIFHRWLSKSGELEITEMLPDPDHLAWQEADGRRTFELRTLIVPRE